MMDLPRQEQLALASVIVSLPVLWHISGKALNRFLTKRYAVSYDIPYVASERPEENRIKGAAVICGGSVAGLLIARICANHFEEVIIIEPEEWTNTPGASEPTYDKDGNVIDPSRFYRRKRIEQYESIHAFLPIVLELCNKLFPDFERDILNADGRIRRGALNMQHRDGRVFRDATTFPIIYASRDLFERILRREVIRHERIRQITGTATGVRASPNDLCKLEGVTFRLLDGAEMFLPASLVVDCTGPTQAGHKWLKRLFENADAKPQIAKSIPFEDLKIEYSTGIVAHKWRVPIPPEMRGRLPIPGGYDSCGWIYSYLGVVGKEGKTTTITRIEGHRFELNCAMRAEPGEQPPSAPGEILSFVKSMSDFYKIPEWFLEVVNILLEIHDQWVDGGVDNGVTFSCVQYERAPFLPHNFVAIGDSYARVNPVYGQGVAKAGASALILDNLLRARGTRSGIPNGFGRDFADVYDRKLSSIWASSKNADYQWPTTTPVKGEDRSVARKEGAFVDLLMQLAVQDDSIDSLLAGVRSFLRPPTDLLHPTVLIKIGWFKLKQTLGFA